MCFPVCKFSLSSAIRSAADNSILVNCGKFQYLMRINYSVKKLISLLALVVVYACASSDRKTENAGLLRIQANEVAGTFSVLRAGNTDTVLVQHARHGVRPYIHPIV